MTLVLAAVCVDVSGDLVRRALKSDCCAAPRPLRYWNANGKDRVLYNERVFTSRGLQPVQRLRIVKKREVPYVGRRKVLGK